MGVKMNKTYIILYSYLENDASITTAQVRGGWQKTKEHNNQHTLRIAPFWWPSFFMMMDGSHTTLYELHNYTNGMQYISLAYIFLFMSGHFWT